MSKAFTKEDESDEEDTAVSAEFALPQGVRNLMTPEGFATLQAELTSLLRVERPKIVEIVSWAAGNGDRSENGDYLYGKKRLREIDRRIRFLTKRLESAEVVDPALQKSIDRVFFGATVSYENGRGEVRQVKLVGIDEADLARGRISWLSPVARALMKARVGDTVRVQIPAGTDSLEILAVDYTTRAG
jgi:transcription elongation factor GreB